MGRKDKKGKSSTDNVGSKILDVDASMQGKICFKDPVNLRINGKFEGNLDTKGSLIVNKNAIVNAEIKGEDIEVAGTVAGNIFASSLALKSSAKITGDIKTSLFSVDKGAVFNGKCEMTQSKKSDVKTDDLISENLMNLDELSSYIDVDKNSILKLVEDRKIPAKKIDNDWQFNREEIDSWISTSN